MSICDTGPRPLQRYSVVDILFKWHHSLAMVVISCWERRGQVDGHTEGLRPHWLLEEPTCDGCCPMLGMPRSGRWRNSDPRVSSMDTQKDCDRIGCCSLLSISSLNSKSVAKWLKPQRSSVEAVGTLPSLVPHFLPKGDICPSSGSVSGWSRWSLRSDPWRSPSYIPNETCVDHPSWASTLCLLEQIQFNNSLLLFKFL